MNRSDLTFIIAGSFAMGFGFHDAIASSGDERIEKLLVVVAMIGILSFVVIPTWFRTMSLGENP